MLDLFRYGASLEAYTGFIMLVVSIEYLYHDVNSFFRKLLVIGSTYLIIVSGHPQMSFYALLGSGIFLFIIPLLYMPEKKDTQDKLIFIRNGCLLIATGILISSVFSLPFYFDYLQNNSTRAQMSYQDSLMFSGTPEGIYNNFIIPFRSNVHSAFGASSLFFIGTISIFLGKYRLTHKAAFILFFVILSLTLIMSGDYGILHNFLWNYMPLYSSFRIPGRISFILPFLIILAYVLYLRYTLKYSNRNSIMSTHIKLCALFVFLSLYSIFYLKIPPEYTPIHLRDITYFIELLFVAINASLIIFIGLFISSTRRSVKLLSAILSIFFVIFSSSLVLYYGTWMQPYEEAVSKNIKSFDEFEKKIKPLGNFGYGQESKNTKIQLNNFKFDKSHAIMVPKIIFVEDLTTVFRHLNDFMGDDHAVIINKASKNREMTLCSNNCNYSIERYCHTYNKHDYKISNNKPGLVKINFPFNSNWTATINDKYTPVLSANGFETAIIIPKSGGNILTLKYVSTSFLFGLFISLATLTIITILGINRLSIKNNYKILMIVSIVILSTYIFSSRENWLYGGDCLPQNYSWNKIYQ